MNPQNPLPPADNQQNLYQTPPAPQQYPPLTQAPPPTPPRSKKLLIIVALIALLLGVTLGAWFLMPNEKEAKPKKTPAPTSSNKRTETDKQGIQKAVDAYCQKLGKAYGFVGMDSGYIISDRFSEKELSDSPDLLRFKQVGQAASATVDCEDLDGPNGIGNDLLFAKKDGAWTYVDEEQNDAGSGFLCSIVDKYKVSKELVSKCAPSEGAETQPR